MLRFRLLPFTVRFAAGLGALLLTANLAVACPFCTAPSLTLAEQVDKSDAVLFARWAGGKKAEGEDPGQTHYEVVQVVKSRGDTFSRGDRVSLVRYRPGKPEDHVLLFALVGKNLNPEWDPPLPATKAAFKYVQNAPAPKIPTARRLRYYLDYLEFPDEVVATDAYSEFANAPYEEIRKLADDMPAERLRKWILDDETVPTRLGLYGLLLGLSGDQEDAEAMEELIVQPTTDFRLGIEGVMSGYLLLTGEKGLERIEETKFEAEVLRDANGKPVLDAEGKPEPVPFSETYAGMQALRFLWDYGDGVVPAGRIKESMRMLLDRPELVDLVIMDLSRWKDWEVMDRVVKLYGSEGYDIASIKRAIVRYVIAATKDVPESDDEKPGKHVAKAKEHLEKLRKRDPKIVNETERFFFLQ